MSSKENEHLHKAESSVLARLNLRVLIVEDEALIQLMLQDTLEDMGFVVHGVCTTVEQALIAAATAGFDVAILDVDLNEHQITPVSKMLCERGIPFVFSTGSGAAGIPDGFGHYPLVEKPYSNLDLQVSLDKAMKGSWPINLSAPEGGLT